MTSSIPPLEVALGSLRSGTGRVFAGRDRGELCRQEVELDEADKQGRPVIVHVPKKTYSVNSSFFLAMFGPSIRHHGAQRFRELYEFRGWDATQTVEDAIREAISTESPFDDGKD